MITLTGTDTLNTSTYNKTKGILYYGDDNLYPNYNRVFADNSAALRRVLQMWSYFVFGQGMEGNFWKQKVNQTGLRVDQLLKRIIDDYGTFGGFAVHITYDGTLTKKYFTPVNFETLRLGEPDDFGTIRKIKRYKDWSASRIQTKDIQDYDVYNDDPQIKAQQIKNAGGIEKWKGQIWYFGHNGEVKYPHTKFHSVIEDVVTDIKMKNGRNAAASTNFMPSHLMQVPFTWKQIAESMSTTTGRVVTPEEVEEEFTNKLQKFMSYDNLGKIAVIQNGMTDNEGKMINFQLDKVDIQNYDAVFEKTAEMVKEAIRGIYSTPAILLEPVATGFSTEIMQSAYNFYNNITGIDRQMFEEVFMELFNNSIYSDIAPDLFKIERLEYITNEQTTTDI